MEILKLILELLDVLIWPGLVLFFLVYYKDFIEKIIERVKLKSANLPGGITLNFDKEIREGKELRSEVIEEKKIKNEKKVGPSIPLTQANARMIHLGLEPSPSGLDLQRYFELAESDSNLALAGLRIEVEVMLGNLAKGFGIPAKEFWGADINALKLRDKNAITSTQYNLIKLVLKLCNSAIHGASVSVNQAKEILEIGSVLRDDYISWLGWGFPGK